MQPEQPPKSRPSRRRRVAPEAATANAMRAHLKEVEVRVEGRLHSAIEDRAVLELALRNLLSASDRPHEHMELHEGLSVERCPFCQARAAAEDALRSVRHA